MAEKVKVNGEMVSTKQAAIILGISAARVRKMIADGFFEGVTTFGQSNAIPLAEVLKVKAEREAMKKSDDGRIVGGRPKKIKGE